MSSTLRAYIRRLLADRRGMSMIETAVVIPALAMMLAGVSDVAMGYSAKLKIQQAANRTVEMATAAGTNGPAFALLQSEAATAAAVPSGQVTVDKWLECASVRQGAFDGACASGQQVARYVSITIDGSYRPKFPLMQYLSGTSMALRGYSAVRLQ
jgi:Flp pilus assembly protein TadG